MSHSHWLCGWNGTIKQHKVRVTESCRGDLDQNLIVRYGWDRYLVDRTSICVLVKMSEHLEVANCPLPSLQDEIERPS